MARLSIVGTALFAAATGAFAALRRSQAGQQLAAATRDVRDEQPYCVFWGQDSHSSPVQVFVGSDGSRSLFFGTDDMGTQTSVKCIGDTPANCATTQRENSINTTQSCDDLNCGCKRDTSELEFTYMKKMMDEVLPICTDSFAHKDFKMLLIGLGGGALPSYTLANCPDGSKVESVEYDSRVVAAATGFFGLNLNDNNQVETNDGGIAVQERVDRGATYDVVLIDCFKSGGDVPFSCRSPALISNLKKILKPGGKAIQQVWAGQARGLLQNYTSVFGQGKVRDEGVELNFNHLVIAEQSEQSQQSAQDDVVANALKEAQIA